AAAKDAADRALALDPDLPETRLALGYYRYWGQRDFTGGLAEFSKLKRVFRITLISPMRSPLSNAGLGIGKRRLTSSVVSLSSILATPWPISLSRLRMSPCAVFPKL